MQRVKREERDEQMLQAACALAEGDCSPPDGCRPMRARLLLLPLLMITRPCVLLPTPAPTQDIFGSLMFEGDTFEGVDSGTAAGGAAGVGGIAAWEAAAGLVEVEELPTLVVTRETKEHANVFHTFTGGDRGGRFVACKVLLSAAVHDMTHCVCSIAAWPAPSPEPASAFRAVACRLCSSSHPPTHRLLLPPSIHPQTCSTHTSPCK